MVALIFGIVIRNSRGLSLHFRSGVAFASKRLLRLGIVLLGLRLSFLEAVAFAQVGIPVIIACVVTGLLIPQAFNKVTKLPGRLVTLIGVGTSICGVSAIAAMSPSIRANEHETTYAVATITLFGLLATLVYPMIAAFVFSGRTLAAAVFLGVSIHDTSQVTGAAFLYQDYFADPQVVEAAMITKLLRNVLMVIVIPLGTYWYNRRLKPGPTGRPAGSRSQPAVPYFVLGFLAATVVRAVGDYVVTGHAAQTTESIAALDHWRWFIHQGEVLSSFLIVVALSAVGLNTPLAVFRRLGLKPLMVGLFAAVLVGIVGAVLIYLLDVT